MDGVQYGAISGLIAVLLCQRIVITSCNVVKSELKPTILRKIFQFQSRISAALMQLTPVNMSVHGRAGYNIAASLFYFEPSKIDGNTWEHLNEVQS